MRRILRNVLIIAMLIAGCILLTGCSSNQTNDDVAEGGTKVLRVGMECAYAPYNWAQKDTSNGAVPIAGSTEYAYGYDVMMAKFLAEKLNTDFILPSFIKEEKIIDKNKGDLSS